LRERCAEQYNQQQIPEKHAYLLAHRMRWRMLLDAVQEVAEFVPDRRCAEGTRAQPLPPEAMACFLHLVLHSFSTLTTRGNPDGTDKQYACNRASRGESS
jgi:hypothetical protein